MTEFETERELQLDFVRRNADSGRKFIQWRDVAICKAYGAGASFAVIAEAAKMTRQGIQKVVERQHVQSVDNSVTDSVEL